MKIILFTLLLTFSLAYYQNQEQRVKVKDFLSGFLNEFRQQYDSISLGGLDFLSNMELGLGYWITRLRVRSLEHITFDFDVEHEIVEFKAAKFYLDIVIEEKYTIPVLIEDLSMSIIINGGENHLRCTGVELDYSSVYLDSNVVVSYLTKQLLSVDMLKKALKDAEIPLRNLFANALRNNWQRTKPLLELVFQDLIQPNSVVYMIPTVLHIQIENRELVLNLRNMFGQKSQITLWYN
ncbi:hypothetical protein pb186bvf_013780 [Paramecium bursaria]